MAAIKSLRWLRAASGDNALTRSERVALPAFIAIAIAFHMSILALTLALTLVFWMLKCFASRFSFPTPRLRLPVTATVVAALCFAPTSNLIITGRFAFTPGGTTFLFGRLVEDGIIGQYLSDHCPDATLRLCGYKDRLPTTTVGSGITTVPCTSLAGGKLSNPKATG
jgi:hypothetical protein